MDLQDTGSDWTVIERVTRSWLQAPFRCYAKMFLRVTHAVSRQQEFIADELAARTLGAKPLADGLCSVHRVAPAIDYYWLNECGPVLSAGFLPPLADGFDIVRARHISERMDKHLQVQLSDGHADPYDTHPPLRNRIAAIGHLPHGPTPEQDLPAASLLENVPALEKELLAKLAGETKLPDCSRSFGMKWVPASTSHGGHGSSS